MDPLELKNKFYSPTLSDLSLKWSSADALIVGGIDDTQIAQLTAARGEQNADRAYRPGEGTGDRTVRSGESPLGNRNIRVGESAPPPSGDKTYRPGKNNDVLSTVTVPPPPSGDRSLRPGGNLFNTS